MSGALLRQEIANHMQGQCQSGCAKRKIPRLEQVFRPKRHAKRTPAHVRTTECSVQPRRNAWNCLELQIRLSETVPPGYAWRPDESRLGVEQKLPTAMQKENRGKIRGIVDRMRSCKSKRRCKSDSESRRSLRSVFQHSEVRLWLRLVVTTGRCCYHHRIYLERL